MGWLQAVIQAADKVFSLDQGKRAAHKDREFQWRALQEQLKYQREFAQQGLSWRVADAKAAGLHPLSALGAQGLPSYSPVSVSSDSSGVSAALSKDVRVDVATKMEREAAAAALRESASRVAANEAEAGYYNALAAKESQRQISEPAFPKVNMTPEEIIGSSVPEFATSFVATPGDAAIAQGSTPLWRTFTLATSAAGQEIPIVLPGGMKGDAAEVLESVSESWPMMYAVYKENVKRFGPQWGNWFLDNYAFRTPFKVQDRGHVFRKAREYDKGFLKDVGRGIWEAITDGRIR